MKGPFKATDGSRLGHGCCFSATVIDGDGNTTCETFDMEGAQAIANALNAALPDPAAVAVDPGLRTVAQQMREAFDAAALDCRATDPVSARMLSHSALMVNDQALLKLRALIR